eukprot:scaffold4560_cov95-Isochrysis_galbana.AAC.3
MLWGERRKRGQYRRGKWLFLRRGRGAKAGVRRTCEVRRGGWGLRVSVSPTGAKERPEGECGCAKERPGGECGCKASASGGTRA